MHPTRFTTEYAARFVTDALPYRTDNRLILGHLSSEPGQQGGRGYVHEDRQGVRGAHGPTGESEGNHKDKDSDNEQRREERPNETLMYPSVY